MLHLLREGPLATGLPGSEASFSSSVVVHALAGDVPLACMALPLMRLYAYHPVVPPAKHCHHAVLDVKHAATSTRSFQQLKGCQAFALVRVVAAGVTEVQHSGASDTLKATLRAAGALDALCCLVAESAPSVHSPAACPGR